MDILHDREGGIDLIQRGKDVSGLKQNFFDGSNLLNDANDIQ